MRLWCALLGAIVAGSLHAQPARTRSPADSAILARAMQVELRYFDQWRALWTSKFDDRRLLETWGTSVNKTGQSWWVDTIQGRNSWRAGVDLMWDAHCALEVAPPPAGPLRKIRSAASASAACPAWLRGKTGAQALAGRVSVDSLRRMTKGDRVMDAQLHVIALLDSAAKALPGNAWVAGQRVRFALDSDGGKDALTVARQCVTNRWWCSALVGYVLAQRGDLLAADSAFAVATAAIAGEARCQWTDIRGLLGPGERREYASLSCPQRDSVSATLFWLADPAWAQPGNERRVEDYSRKVSLMLRSALERDEVYNWHPELGGDAVAEMVLRYGWPSQNFWYGRTFDAELDRWLRDRNSLPSSPHTIPEYTHDRVHLVPSWHALRDPHHADAADWMLAADTVSAWMLDIPVLNWWQAEHFLYGTPIVQFGESQTGVLCREAEQSPGNPGAVQTALLRRDDGLLIGFATELGPLHLGRAADDTLTATLVWSSGPDVIKQLGTTRVIPGGRLVMHSLLAANPGLLGVEIPSIGAGKPMARSRFGLTPPSAFSAITRGGTAVSEAVLVEPPPDGSALSNNPEVVLDHMLGSTLLPAGTRTVGIYWESYGFALGDSLQVSLRVQRHTSQGMFRTIGIAMNIADDRNTPVAMSWTEPDLTRSSLSLAARIPTVGRSVVLDISTLPAGEYSLDVSVGRPGTQPAVSRRTFVVR